MSTKRFAYCFYEEALGARPSDARCDHLFIHLYRNGWQNSITFRYEGIRISCICTVIYNRTINQNNVVLYDYKLKKKKKTNSHVVCGNHLQSTEMMLF